MSDGDAVLFAEPGARWRAVLYGPLLCLLVLVLEMVTSSPVHWFALIFCGALIAAFVALQVVAGRRHVSVELTGSTLRQGAETLPLTGIAGVLPERDEHSWNDEDWESARALGELSGVPRRRKGIGLRLRDGGLVQAWARDHRGLRTALTAALSSEGGEALRSKSAEAQESKSAEVLSSEDAAALRSERAEMPGSEGAAALSSERGEARKPEGTEERHGENGADR
ncbi:hypothetical protein SAMN04244553_2859 [Nocardia amikacinitolerans]|uniref:DUF3093 domain-containing protein n=1 Tax=Nocardia amikacinitolerans TaxID=756689 RepID=A0A285LCY6_9NOCA|nr:hypothetical protein [Nocardia amikacinitolerans]MCP2299000.1 hypothetical protein [Nocardia amikacinitolerans]SNY81271.1 hypothetical protein SAMN04244553_2859 [Nocardia amikacinitolerans]